MADGPSSRPGASRPSKFRQIVKAITALLVLLALGVGGAALWLDSDSGHRFVKHRIEAWQFDNGLRIRIGSIDGSLFGQMQLRNIRLHDPQGIFAASPHMGLDWRPLGLLRRHVNIRSIDIPAARLARLPKFTPVPDTDEPLLPDIDIDVDRFSLAALDIAPAVTGHHHRIQMGGKVHIADRRALVTAQGRAIAATDMAGGDHFNLRLVAVPDANRLDLALDLTAPGDGLIAGLTGMAKPLTARLSGRGDWRHWNGRFDAASGLASVAALNLAARSGVFTVRGQLQGGTSVNLTAAADQRRLTLTGRASNDNFTLTANGLADLGRNRFGDLALDFRLLRPSALASQLTGAGVSAAVTLDGAMAAPDITYRVKAAEIGVGKIRLVGLNAAGRAAMDARHWRIPVQASVARIAGLNPTYGELLNQVRLDGDLAYAGGRLLSDNLRIKSPRVNAAAILVADISRGLYTGSLKGRVDDYRIDSVGLFNLNSDIDLAGNRDGRFALTGTIRARSSRIFSDGARQFLGGNALIVADVRYGSDGIAQLRSLRVAAPDFRLVSGNGTYHPSGAIALRAQGSADQYGPLQLELSGTTSAPVARILAARPGLGVGLTQVVALVRANPAGYGVTATGDSDYGPLAANVDILAGRDALTLDLKPGTSFAGVALGGRISRTAAGPFAGQLAAQGSGIDGTVMLSAAGTHQHAAIKLAAHNAQLPGPAGLSAERAYLDADLTLYDSPQITADAQVAGLRVRDTHIAAARAKLRYRNGAGTAQLVAEGRSAIPFRVAANAIFAPDQWRVALQGRANGVDFRSLAPARIVVRDGEYSLQQTRIALTRGSLDLAGRFGRGLTIHSQLDNVDLALANPFLGGLGLGGTASGSLSFVQENASTFPRAEARLTIDDFTRADLAAVSVPVDVALTAHLSPDGGDARAIFRHRGAVIGRLQANLSPLPSESGPWQTRLLAAPLSGGVRYNGPAGPLFSLTALPDQQLTGAIGVAADFSGRAQRPVLTGVVRANNLTYENHNYGTRLINLRVRGTFTNDQLEVTELTARAGDGTVSGKGFVSLSSAKGFPVQLNLDLDRAQLARGGDLAASATGQLQLVSNDQTPMVLTGQLHLPETRYRIIRDSAAEVATLTGIRRKAPKGRQPVSGDPDPITSVPGNIKLDIDLVADNRIFVTGMGLNSEWSANLKLRGTTGAPQMTGNLDLVRGTLDFSGRSFELQRGHIRFPDGVITNPRLDLVAAGTVADISVTLNLAGSAEKPQISFTSTPGLPQDEIMARLLFGNGISELSPVQAIQLAASLNNLRGGRGGLNPLGVLQSSIGIDRLRILDADHAAGRGTALAAGQYITNDVYVEIITDARGYTATQLEIGLTPALSLLSSFSSFGASSVNIRYRKDY